MTSIRQRQHVDRFVRDIYRPYLIRQTIGPVLKDVHDALAAPDDALDPVDIMEVYVEEISAQGHAFRREATAALRAAAGGETDA